MDIGTIIGLVIGIAIIIIGIWAVPPKNLSEKMKTMSDEERKKRENKNLIFALIQFLFSIPMLIVYFLIILFVIIN